MKLKIYDNYLNEETKNLRKDWITKKDYETDSKVIVLITYMIIFLCFFLPVNSFPNVVGKKDLQSSILYPIWICKKCGYSNYNGANHCGVCGKDKFSSASLCSFRGKM